MQRQGKEKKGKVPKGNVMERCSKIRRSQAMVKKGNEENSEGTVLTGDELLWKSMEVLSGQWNSTKLRHDQWIG